MRGDGERKQERREEVRRGIKNSYIKAYLSPAGAFLSSYYNILFSPLKNPDCLKWDTQLFMNHSRSLISSFLSHFLSHFILSFFFLILFSFSLLSSCIKTASNSAFLFICDQVATVVSLLYCPSCFPRLLSSSENFLLSLPSLSHPFFSSVRFPSFYLFSFFPCKRCLTFSPHCKPIRRASSSLIQNSLSLSPTNSLSLLL